MSLIRAVTEALLQGSERLQERNREIFAADIQAIAKRASTHIKSPYLDHAEFLYNEHGLPK